MKKTLLRAMGIAEDHPWLQKIRKTKRRWLRTDLKLRAQYLNTAQRHKLHLGSSNHLLDGWLNTDLFPSRGVMELDATSTYPFQNDSFEFVYSEHMIEHVPYAAAIAMLRECFRILKPGGVIRVVTPDLAKILNIYPQPKDELGQKYLSWMSSTFTPGIRENHVSHVVNAFFRLWGHQFLYDEPTLRNTLAMCGFTSIERHELGKSSYSELQSLENVTRYPEGLLNYESICLEGRKPSSAANQRV